MVLTVGYNFLYWSNVTRPGMAYDLVVDSNNVGVTRPGISSPRPAFDFAGILVTRVVNAVKRTKSDFATVELAELRVVAD